MRSHIQLVKVTGTVLLALFLSTTPAGAAIAFVISPTPVGVSSGNAVTTGVNTTTVPINFCLVYVATALHNAATLTTLTDSVGNTYTASSNSATTTNNRQGAFFYSCNCTGSSSHTWTASNSSSYITIFPSTWSGVATSSCADQHNENNALSTSTIQPNSVTPGQNNEVLVTGISLFQGSGTISINSSYTIDRTYQSGTFEGGSVAYLLQTTAAASNPTWTVPVGEVAANIITFKPSVAATTIRHKVTQQ